jgi:hypothetical protein
MAFSSKTQSDYANLMNNACYVMSIAYGLHTGFLSLLQKGLNEGSVKHSGWVQDAERLSGCRVAKVTFPSSYDGPKPKFVVLELDHGKHFVVGKIGAEKLALPTDKAGWVEYDPAGNSNSQIITGLRVFYGKLSAN